MDVNNMKCMKIIMIFPAIRVSYLYKKINQALGMNKLL
jgi:hypothetical protein